MRLSVALCTYNGEKYIEEQLFSILNQSQRVDEIVVCDDGSTDGTIDILRNISKMNNDVIIRIYINEHNLGVCANFEKAIYLCNGDIIFLSDQDDIWNTNKVKIIVNWFDKNPDKSVVFTDADLIDSKGERLIENKALWDFTGFNAKIQKQFDEGYGFELIASQNRCTGATMALRKEIVFNFNIEDNNCVFHDEIIAITAICRNALGYIKSPLMKYRVHENQVAGICMNLNAITDKYSTNSKSVFYKNILMSERWKKRLSLFILRSNIPKQAVIHVDKYIGVYGICGLSFWCHDIVKLLKYIVKS